MPAMKGRPEPVDCDTTHTPDHKLIFLSSGVSLHSMLKVHLKFSAMYAIPTSTYSIFKLESIVRETIAHILMTAAATA